MSVQRAAVRLRAMTVDDVPRVLDVQQPGAVQGLADVFPQDAHPFPREAVGRRWLEEVEDPGTGCFVVLLDGEVAGFAVTRRDELLHLGTAVEQWGTGLAQVALEAVLDQMRAAGVRTAWLRVFTDNARGRRFYEKLGWREVGEPTRSTFAPYAELLRCERDLA